MEEKKSKAEKEKKKKEKKGKDVQTQDNVPVMDISETAIYNKDFVFDKNFENADGPIPSDQEQVVPTDLLPSLLFSSLTDAHLEKIKQFRADPEIAEWIYPPSEHHHLHTDFYLTRYLIAREWDFQKAKEMFIKAMKWRRANNVDNIIVDFEQNKYFPFLQAYWPGSFNREWDFWSFDNSFVTYQRIGCLDESLVNYVPQDVLVRYHIYCAEILEMKYNKVVKEKGYCPGCIMVEDLTGLGMNFVDKKFLDLLKEVVDIDNDYYPAILRKFYIINTPRVFSMIWGVVKKFFDKATLDKFEIVSSDKKVVPLLKKVVPMKYLPDYLEGESNWKIPAGGSPKELAAKYLPKT